MLNIVSFSCDFTIKQTMTKYRRGATNKQVSPYLHTASFFFQVFYSSLLSIINCIYLGIFNTQFYYFNK